MCISIFSQDEAIPWSLHLHPRTLLPVSPYYKCSPFDELYRNKAQFHKSYVPPLYSLDAYIDLLAINYNACKRLQTTVHSGPVFPLLRLKQGHVGKVPGHVNNKTSFQHQLIDEQSITCVLFIQLPESFGPRAHNGRIRRLRKIRSLIYIHSILNQLH